MFPFLESLIDLAIAKSQFMHDDFCFFVFLQAKLYVMRKLLPFLLLLIGLVQVQAQDVIQVMQYNLLNYGNLTSYCTSTNNSALMKNEHFKTIFQYAKPDILTVNEMAENSIYHDSLLRNTLNVDGETAYKRATITSTSQGDWLVNMLYYNSRKLTLQKHEAINTIVRATDVYRMYYNAADLAETEDTVFITHIVTHLKAGTATDDAADRATMTAAIMNYIQTHDIQNYLFSGDLNVYTSTETAYQNLIKDYSGVHYLYDPIDAPGAWNNNAAFSAIHSQSTHVSSNGCASTGGLDDRLDFILSSGALMDGTHGMQIQPNTYHVLGNDGAHFNLTIVSPTNTSAPADVITALYNASDHLPILVQITTEQSYLALEEITDALSVKFQNPVDQQLNLHLSFAKPEQYSIRIYDLTGRMHTSLEFSESNIKQDLSIDLQGMKSGIYFLHIKTANGQESVNKFLKR